METKERGLTTADAEHRRIEFGYNEVPEKKASPVKKFIHWLISPISLMLLLAAALSFYSKRAFDGYFILVLLVLNYAISAWQEHRADHAIQQLQEKLTVTVRVKRNGVWQSLPARQLVPGDIISLDVGDVVPADTRVLEADNLSLNEASITGESLPQDKGIGGQLFSGSSVTTGTCVGIVTAIGTKTTYGKTLLAVERASKRSLLEQDITSIAGFLSLASLVVVIILSVVLWTSQSASEILRLDLSLIIAGVPVSMPTVMAIIISLGVLKLSEREVIVRRMSALENLSNVTLLLTDKTGTLTENNIVVEKTIPLASFSGEELIRYAALTVHNPDKNPIEKALYLAARQLGKPIGAVDSLTPADSIRKRATAFVTIQRKAYIVAVGAPQIIAALCQKRGHQTQQLTKHLKTAAQAGYRALALAIKQSKDRQEHGLELAGLILLSDRIRPDAADAIAYLKEQGISSKIVTGDSHEITGRVAEELGIGGTIAVRSSLDRTIPITARFWQSHAGFAEVLPQDKYRLVEAAKQQAIVAVTGDGINDLPAIAAADVGIAVSNAVDALKGSADIVMLASGISFIKDALIEARKIFERLYSYSVYRISESFRLILTIGILGIAVHAYPVTPIQLLLLAFLNDLPIISLAYNHVRLSGQPSRSRSRNRFLRGLLHGTVGICSSLGLYWLLANVIHLPIASVQTAFFLKLAVSGHMLIYVAHTDEHWYHFLPSRIVIFATTGTQLLASLLALTGLFMAPISLGLIGFVWAWSFLWMQVSDIGKALIPQK